MFHSAFPLRMCLQSPGLTQTSGHHRSAPGAGKANVKRAEDSVEEGSGLKPEGESVKLLAGRVKWRSVLDVCGALWRTGPIRLLTETPWTSHLQTQTAQDLGGVGNGRNWWGEGGGTAAKMRCWEKFVTCRDRRKSYFSVEQNFKGDWCIYVKMIWLPCFAHGPSVWVTSLIYTKCCIN